MNSRGQSEVVGIVLLLGLVITATAGIVLIGSDSITSATTAATGSAAEHAMAQLDSQASLVAHGGSDFQRTQISGAKGAERRVEPDSGRMNVTIRNETTGAIEEQLVNVTLGAVVYENDGTTIAYQGGGVWRTYENGSGMVSPPEFRYRGSTLTLPLVTVVAGDRNLDEEVLISAAGQPRDVYPNASEGLANPLEDGKIVVEVHSDYYDAWGRFFSERTAGEATIDHGNETATIELVSPISQDETISNALHSNAAGDEIELSGSGNAPSFVDSYNSSMGNYSATKRGNGTVLTSGDVKLSGNAKVKGYVRSGGTATLSGSSNVTKGINWTTGFSASGNAEYGNEEQIDGVTEARDISQFVLNRIDSSEDENDNGDTTAIDGDRLNFSGGDTVTLDHDDGDRFYLKEIDMADPKKLVVQTRGDQVEIAVGSDFTLDNADVQVKGTGTVRLYVSDDVSLDDGTNVSVPGKRSRQFWLYGTPDTDIDMEGSSSSPIRFVGVIYVTGDSGNDFDVQHMDLYGGVIAGEMDIGTGGAIHYDAGLRNAKTLPANANIPRVKYLHISISEIRVEDD
jgi:hypothetical protein